MLYHGAKAGAFELRDILEETLTCMRRSGVDIIISYFTPQLLQWMQEDRNKATIASILELRGGARTDEAVDISNID
jgi:hypothetical protein